MGSLYVYKYTPVIAQILTIGSYLFYICLFGREGQDQWRMAEITCCRNTFAFKPETQTKRS